MTRYPDLLIFTSDCPVCDLTTGFFRTVFVYRWSYPGGHGLLLFGFEEGIYSVEVVKTHHVYEVRSLLSLVFCISRCPWSSYLSIIREPNRVVCIDFWFGVNPVACAVDKLIDFLIKNHQY